MTAVELAVRKVKKLSAHQAKELLGWLTARQSNETALKQLVSTGAAQNGRASPHEKTQGVARLNSFYHGLATSPDAG